jgi:hypothetical protein
MNLLAYALFLAAPLMLWHLRPQDPQPPAAAPRPPLLSLQLLLVESVFVREPLASEPSSQDPAGSAAMVPVAQVVDARFARSGELTMLVVTAVDRAGPAHDPTPRLLPAREVAFDAKSGKWCLLHRELAIASLRECRVERLPTAGGQQAAEWTGSRLVLATPAAAKPATPPPGGETKEAAAAPKPVIWWIDVTTTPIRIELGVLPAGGRSVPVPWSVLRITDHADELTVSSAASDSVLAAAPVTKTRSDRPDEEMRRRMHEHFRTADAAPAPAPSKEKQ